MKIIAISILLLFANSFAAASDQKPIVLTESSVGSIEILKGMKISLHMLWKAFPYYRVKHEIGMGDSPDFHIFTVETHEGEAVVVFISYIREKSMYESAFMPLDEVVLLGGGAKDQYGVSPGDRLSSAMGKHKNMKHGYGHMDSYIGSGKIWYLFHATTPEGMRATQEQATEINPKIEVISWPIPRWR